MKPRPCSTDLADAIAGRVTVIGIPRTFPSGRIGWLYHPLTTVRISAAKSKDHLFKTRLRIAKMV